MSFGKLRSWRLRRVALSLAELLICVSIVVTLAALTLPALRHALLGGLRTADIETLRQLGAAGSMYREEHGAWPLTTTDLVRSTHVPATLTTSSLDRTRAGWANELLAYYRSLGSSGCEEVPPYRRSFVGWFDGCRSRLEFTELIETNAAGGLFVGFMPRGRAAQESNPLEFDGAYLRLTLDGAVVTRRQPTFRGRLNGRVVEFSGPLFWFVDATDQWKQEYIDRKFRQ